MHAFIHCITRIKRRTFTHKLASPVDAQKKEFTNILQFLKDTEYVRDNGGQPVSYEAFSKAFPIVAYEKIYPYIERSLKGETNVLVPGIIADFAKSSGTTNAKSKYIPINRKSLKKNHYRAGADAVAWSVDTYQLHSAVLGKTLGISGSFSVVPDVDESVRAGDVSAFLNTLVPWWAKLHRYPSQKVALIPDWNIKKEIIVNDASTADIRIIVGTPTWVLRILEGIRDSGKKVSDVWPRLQLFIHGAVAFGPYKESFKQLTNELDVQLVEAYNATEGFFAFGNADTNGMYLLTHHGIFYEFIEKAEWSNDRPTAIPLWEVEKGIDYALVVTGYNGLVRYMIGDVIRFVGTDPYTIEIVGRTKHFINAFGEEVMGSQLEQALTHACEKTGARITAFTVAPCFYENGKGCHEWLIEFEQVPNFLDVFIDSIDEHLQSLNSDYEAKRNGSGILGLPKITTAQAGMFMKYLESKNKLGAQNKIPVVMNTRELLEEILKY